LFVVTTQERLRVFGAFVVTAACLSLGANTSVPQARLSSGKLAGVVRDINGVPQMGATVEVVPEIVGTTARLGFLTNTQGVFRDDRMVPGLYTVRVTLAGFLPTLQQHVRISSHLTTVVRVELESMFASLDQLRRQPAQVPVENDDWKWVLRSATVTRPVLEWSDDDDGVIIANSDTPDVTPRARLDFTDGARRPGSASNIPSAPATAFAYDQKLGGPARLLLAGEVNYEGTSAGGGFATVWLPAGSLDSGPSSTLVVRESKLGPEGPTFRGVRMQESGALALGQGALLRYSGEYVMVGVAKMATSLRPRLQLDLHPVDGWQTSLIFASENGTPLPLDPDERQMGSELASALDELDSLPIMLWRDGSPVLEGGWHEEIAAGRKLGAHGEVRVAGFHDDNRHVAVFGRGNDLPASDFLQDYFSNGFAYDGGASGAWGARIALRQKLTEAVELTAVYAYAGALSPLSDSMDTDADMRELLRTSMHNSLGINVSTSVPRLGTRLEGGYKWVSGRTVSRLDGFGESLYQMEPFVHLGLRQALPKFGPGRWEANARCDNLFAQGYVPLSTQDTHAVLTPAFRSFRGGLSVQF
jgi:Carboxypeptidase regulatory-like domain